MATYTNETIVDQLIHRLNEITKNTSNAIRLIGIDGPTASGKTMLANSLSDKLKKQGVDTWVYRVDWALLDRKNRVEDLANLKKTEDPFRYEAELHMRMEIVEDFCRKVALYNQKFITEKNSTPQAVKLEKLYSRELGGETAGTDEVTLKPGLVVILEGHYTLRTKINDLIDLNCVLIGSEMEFLNRKIARVSGYRGAEEATDYFWRVDVPSFKHHMQRFGLNADLAIDNTDYKAPKVLDQIAGSTWLEKPVHIAGQDINYSDFLFSKSLLVTQPLKDSLVSAIGAIRKWDNTVGQHLRISLGELSSDLESVADGIVAPFNSEMKDYHLKISHTDALYEVYYRRLPVSLGLGIFSNKTHHQEASILVDVTHQNLVLNLFWKGGFKQITIRRNLGEIDDGKMNQVTETTPELSQSTSSDVRVMLPTAFAMPAFLKGITIEPVYIGKEFENISATRALLSLLTEGGVWIQRVSLFQEINFFQSALDACGVSNCRVGNYIIALRHSNKELNQKFKKFKASWETPVELTELFAESQAAYDKIVISERKQAREFMAKNCQHLRLKDGYIFTDFLSGDGPKTQQALKELKMLLSSPIRILRKRATQFIQQYLTGFSIPTEKLWKDLPQGHEKSVTLNSLVSMEPTILGEVYLWLALREENSAVLGANVYDIRENSLDASAHIAAAADKRRPVVLQSSLNAIGHQTAEAYGYLKPKDGPVDLIKACKKAARDYVLTHKGPPPLFGIGLDHVNAENDKPRGRAKDFLMKAAATKDVTHAVLDGSALFKTKSLERKDLEEAYSTIAAYAASLVADPETTYLMDREICAGELSYIGESNKVHYPTVEDLRLFTRALQREFKKKGLEAFLARPMLFIGNLGTTHHGEDKDIPQVEISREWREGLKSENFVSPVLHGTTKSHRDVLARATAGCHKINVAGDLLEVLLKNMPENVYKKSKEFGLDPKKTVPLLRAEFDALQTPEIQRVHAALVNKTSEIMDTINSPKLSPMDENYFRYSEFNYSPEHVDVIVNEVAIWLKAHSNQIKEKHGDSREKLQFAASMIEVSIENMQGELLNTLWNSGIRYFHIDAGDGKFITRKFSGVEKSKIIRSKFPNAILHAHLMVENPHEPIDGGPSYIEQYVEAGCNAIAIHERSLRNPKDVVSVLKLIRRLGARPGLIIETSASIDSNLKQIIHDAELDWSVVMGVPIGYGGQIFQFNTLGRISALHDFVMELGRDFLIECDGGLNFETAKLCKNAGAQIFAGWSIVKAPTLQEISGKVQTLKQVLESSPTV